MAMVEFCSKRWLMVRVAYNGCPTAVNGKMESSHFGEGPRVGGEARGAVVWCGDGEGCKRGWRQRKNHHEGIGEVLL
jgi:hypothetical protein